MEGGNPHRAAPAAAPGLRLAGHSGFVRLPKHTGRQTASPRGPEVGGLSGTVGFSMGGRDEAPVQPAGPDRVWG